MDALLRRTAVRQRRTQGEPKRVGRYTLRDGSHTLVCEEGEVYLSPTEYSILRYLMDNEGVIVTFEEIFRHVWDKPSYGDVRTVFAHIGNLRKKIEPDPSNPVHITTCKRVGYMFNSAAGLAR